MTATLTVTDEIEHAVARHNLESLMREYHEQGEFLVREQFLSAAAIDCFLSEVGRVRSKINRNYIPGHKKGGSVSYYILKDSAPSILSLYRSQAFIESLSRIAGVPLLLCPDDDPHACALYFYTEPGDHIGFHYDTSYYKGNRYTVLIGLIDRSSSKLLCRLHTKSRGRQAIDQAYMTSPGCCIFFNGDLLYHAVSPLGQGEERVVLTLQYVTDPRMGAIQRWFSNMKDAVGYFGLPALLRRPVP